MKKKSKEREKDSNKVKTIFNNIYFCIVILTIIIFSGYTISVTTTATASYSAKEYYEKFEDNLEYYENLTFSNQKKLLYKLDITKTATYESFKKNTFRLLKDDSDDAIIKKDSYFYSLYEKYGETAIKAYYTTFIEPQYTGLLLIGLYIGFAIVLIIMQIVYKYIKIKGVIYSFIIISLLSIISFILAESYEIELFGYMVEFVFPAVLIMFVNRLINYFAFDRKTLKKS